jgi:hypothetical protein
LTLSPPREISRTAVNQLALPYYTFHNNPQLSYLFSALPTPGALHALMPVIDSPVNLTSSGGAEARSTVAAYRERRTFQMQIATLLPPIVLIKCLTLLYLKVCLHYRAISRDCLQTLFICFTLGQLWFNAGWV